MVQDARNYLQRRVTVYPDLHGLVIEIEGTEDALVLELDNDKFRVFTCGPSGELVDESPKEILNLTPLAGQQKATTE